MSENGKICCKMNSIKSIENIYLYDHENNEEINLRLSIKIISKICNFENISFLIYIISILN